MHQIHKFLKPPIVDKLLQKQKKMTGYFIMLYNHFLLQTSNNIAISYNNGHIKRLLNIKYLTKLT